MSDTKHGWVTPRADGAMARCGGPGICATCTAEREHVTRYELKHGLSQCPPGPLEPVELAQQPGAAPAAPASPVSTVEQEDAHDERSATHGMTLGERIAHVGGRTNAQGYIEFGSPMAVNALIQHVLRDIDCTRQDDEGAYQARYRLPGGQWSSWGHVVCGVKGHEQELRYLPGARHHAPAAGDALALQDLQRLLEYAQMSDDSQYGTLSTRLVRDLTAKAIEALAAQRQGGE